MLLLFENNFRVSLVTRLVHFPAHFQSMVVDQSGIWVYICRSMLASRDMPRFCTSVWKTCELIELMNSSLYFFGSMQERPSLLRSESFFSHRSPRFLRAAVAGSPLRTALSTTSTQTRASFCAPGMPTARRPALIRASWARTAGRNVPAKGPVRWPFS